MHVHLSLSYVVELDGLEELRHILGHRLLLVLFRSGVCPFNVNSNVKTAEENGMGGMHADLAGLEGGGITRDAHFMWGAQLELELGIEHTTRNSIILLSYPIIKIKPQRARIYLENSVCVVLN
jgi:hypothetical protein